MFNCYSFSCLYCLYNYLNYVITVLRNFVLVRIKLKLMKPKCIISDVVSIEKTNELFRLIYDVKGRFTIHRITPEEAKVGIFF